MVPPYSANLKKRLVKSHKLYIRDTGLLHALLDIENRNILLGHPSYGASWETFSVEQILGTLRGWKGYFYRTSSGNEIDLILTKGRKKIAVEFKVSSAPELNKGFYIAREDLDPDESWIVAPVTDSYVFDKKRKIHVGNPLHLIKERCQYPRAEPWGIDTFLSLHSLGYGTNKLSRSTHSFENKLLNESE